jgi:hypothetical protein
MSYLPMELKLVVPTSLDEITLEQYQRFARIEGDEEFRQKKMLEIFCQVPFSELPKVRLVDATNVLTVLSKTLNQKPDLTKFFELKGTKYGFIPALNDISLGEFVDLDNYMKDWATMHRAMAVLYRPVTKEKGERYDIEDYTPDEGREELFKQMPVSVALGAMVFFYRLGNVLAQHTLNSLAKEAKTSIQEKRSSDNDGDGIPASMLWLQETSQNLKQSLDYLFINA